jgi:hypothetical protein
MFSSSASPFTPAERRIAGLLLVAAVAGTIWHVASELRPPPLPVTILKGALQPASGDEDLLYDLKMGGVYSEEDSSEFPIPSLPIDLFSADEAELQSLPGVGPVIARRIIEWRSRRKDTWGPDDLLEVSGIGPATLERLRPFITVGEWR